MALQFTAGSFIDVTAYSGVQITGNFTLMCWAKWTTSLTNAPFITRWGANNSYGLGVSAASSNKVIFFFEPDPTGTDLVATSASTYNDSTWHHFAGVYDGANARLYVDGGETESITGSSFSGAVNNPVQNLAFGVYGDHASQYLGELAHIAIWDRGLTQQEVKTAMRYGPHKVPGCTLWMPLFVGGTGTTEPNYAPTGTKNNGSNTSIAAITANPWVTPWFASDEVISFGTSAPSVSASDDLNFPWTDEVLVSRNNVLNLTRSVSDKFVRNGNSNSNDLSLRDGIGFSVAPGGPVYVAVSDLGIFLDDSNLRLGYGLAVAD